MTGVQTCALPIWTNGTVSRLSGAPCRGTDSRTTRTNGTSHPPVRGTLSGNVLPILPDKRHDHPPVRGTLSEKVLQNHPDKRHGHPPVRGTLSEKVLRTVPDKRHEPSACPDLPEARNHTVGSRRIRTEIAQPIATQAAQPTNGEYLPKSTPKPNIRPKGWSFS